LRLTRPAALVASALVLLATPAWAHVTVSSPDARPGAVALLTFRVPNEGTTPTSRVQVAFPSNLPLASVSVRPTLGWTYRVTKTKAPRGLRGPHGPVSEVVSTITWGSTGRGIKPGEFEEFEVTAGPLPRVSRMPFQAVQTYQDGTVVRWVETGRGQQAHPAPVLVLAAGSAPPAPTPSPSIAPSASTAPTPTAEPTVTATPAQDDDGDPLTDHQLALASAGAGGLALVLALLAMVRSSRRRV
jgi:uncharacterized protein YcnI